MELTPYGMAKLALWLVFVPLVFACAIAAVRWLPPESAVRSFLLRHGVVKIATHLLFALLALGGTWLTIAYS